MDYKEKFLEKYNYVYLNAKFFRINFLPEKIIIAIEQVLLEDKPLEEIDGYKYLESLKNNKDHLKRYKDTIEFNNSFNEIQKKMGFITIGNEFTDLCGAIYKHIRRENLDKVAIKKRHDVIDEYARVARYDNTGKEWTSGVYLTSKDRRTHNISMSGIVNMNKEKPVIVDPVVKFNQFIDFFSSNYTYNDNFRIEKLGIEDEFFEHEENRGYHFTEKEKQRIYLIYNECLAYDHKILCNDLGNINRPDGSKGCFKDFILKKENIYIDNNGNYLTICPNCGCINIVLKESLDLETIKYVNKNHSKYDEKINFNNSENTILKKKIKKR